MQFETLQKDMIAAMKAHDKQRKDAISSLISAIKKVAIDEGHREDIQEDLVDRVILKELKTVKEQIDSGPADRTDLKEEYQLRFDVINEYAPSLMGAEEVKAFIKERLNLPKQKADILILAGGGHEKFARNSGIKYEENTLYKDNSEPIMMDIETRRKETERYYKSISLDEIRQRVKDPDWWYATRAMSAFALVVAEAIDAKYIVPTDIAMAYGIIKDGDNKK